MFTAYLDESGSHSDRVFTMAVIVAPASRWVNFCTAWDRAMERSGAQRKTLHMKHVLQGTKGTTEDEDWTGWDEPRRGILFRRLVPSFHAHVSYAFAGTVPVTDFDELLRDRSLPQVEQINPTVWSMQKCLEAVRFAIHPSPTDPVACIFHRTEENSADIQRHFYHLQKTRHWTEIFPTIAFAPARGFPPIQAVDMLAHENYDHWMDMRIAPTGREPRELYRQVTRPPKSVSKLFDRSFLIQENAILEHHRLTISDEEHTELESSYRAAHKQMTQTRDPNFRKKSRGPKK